MNRDHTLDTLRGFFVLYMFSQHLLMGPFAASGWISNYSFYPHGWAPTAAGFIMISGIVIGWGYSRLYQKKGYEALSRAARSQAWKIYLTHMSTFLIVLVTAQFLPAMIAGDGGFTVMGEHPVRQGILAGMLLYQPTFYDILPMYCLYLLITPWVLRSFHKHGPARALGISAALWLSMQVGGFYLFGVILENVQGSNLGLFNPLAWQSIFVVGLYLGYKRLDPKGFLKAIPPNIFGPVLGLSIVVVLAGLATRWEWFGPIPQWLATELRWKTIFPPVFVINFAAVCFVLAVVAGRYPNAFSWRPLRFVGKHPLICFAFHLVIVMLLQSVEGWLDSLSEAQRLLLMAAVITTIAFPATAEEWWQQRKARPAVPPAGQAAA